jgi:hypothetical protein
MLFFFQKKGEKTMKARHNWEEVNWLDQDIVIAKKLGCSKQRVNQKRKELGKDPSPYFHKRNFLTLSKILELNTESMDLDEIAVKMGCSKVYIRNILDQYKKPYIFIDGRKGGKYEWGKADWTKTDKEVAFMLGVPNKATVTQHRKRMGIVKQRVTRYVKEKNVCSWENKRVNV